MDSKRRLLVPQDFRATALLVFPDVDLFEGVYCLPAVKADCLECGGGAFFAMQRDVINEYPPMSPLRNAMQTRYASMHRLGFDTAGRITLPEKLCEQFGLTGDVVIAGMGESFQIWEPVAYEAYLIEQKKLIEAVFAERGGLA